MTRRGGGHYIEEYPAGFKGLRSAEQSKSSNEVSLSIDELISKIKEEEGYPIGLKVLVVDEDDLFLQDIEGMLQKCQYQGTMCSSASEALSMLQDKSRKFDIVLMTILVKDMGGFKKIQQVAMEADLPIRYLLPEDKSLFDAVTLNDILGSYGSKLSKPIRYRDVQCIWFPVAKKREQIIRKMVKQGILDGWECSVISKSLYAHWGDDGSFKKLIKDIQEEVEEEEGKDAMNVKVEEHDISLYPSKKRKIQQGEDHVDTKIEEHYTSSFLKREPKIQWMASKLHEQFLTALYQLGTQNADPAQILQRMNSPDGLTRKDVAIHLKEYRFLHAGAHPSTMPLDEKAKPLRSNSVGYTVNANLWRMYCGSFKD